jgi:quinol monooxygenase YgiN
MIVINVKFPVKPDRVDDWTALAREYAAAVDAEEGSAFFTWSRGLEDPNTFYLVEGFRDADAGAAHTKTPHFAQFVDQAPDLVSAQPQIIYIDAPQVDGWGPMGEISPR